MMGRRIRHRVSIDPIPRQTASYDSATYAGLDHHAHCVTCGMMASLQRFADGPHEVQAYTHYYGGSIRQAWEEAPELRADALRLMLAHVDVARKYLLSELGQAEGQAEETEEDEPDDDWPRFPDDQIEMDIDDDE